MIIGVLSDTHMPRRGLNLPRNLMAGLEKVDLIIHAGDITELWVLDQLSGLAPVIAVAGNVDPPKVAETLGYKKTLKILGNTIGVFHGHGSGGSTLGRAYDTFTSANCIIFGHSHIPFCQKHLGTLMFNPGSPTDKRKHAMYSYGLLFVKEEISGQIIYFN